MAREIVAGPRIEDRDVPEAGAFNNPNMRTYRIEGHGLEPRFGEGEYVTTNSKAEHAHGREIVILRKDDRASIAFCGDSRALLSDVVKASVVVGRSERPYALGRVFPLLAPMPVAKQVRSLSGDAVDLVEPHDRRLATRGPHPDLDAWFEDRMNGDPVSIVITPTATDQRLQALGHRFSVDGQTLVEFKNALRTR